MDGSNRPRLWWDGVRIFVATTPPFFSLKVEMDGSESHAQNGIQWVVKYLKRLHVDEHAQMSRTRACETKTNYGVRLPLFF